MVPLGGGEDIGEADEGVAAIRYPVWKSAFNEAQRPAGLDINCKHVCPSHETQEEQNIPVPNDPTGGEDAGDSSACRRH
jgi:hypothetical protein